MNTKIEIIERSIPGIKVLKKLTSGGQKEVYSIQNGEEREALKLIQIPKIDHPDSDSIQAEIKGRVLREIEVLENCAVPEIVKLGKLKPQVINMDGIENIIYSEELIEGDDLWVLIQNPASPKPSEKELKILFLTLLKAISELWSKGYIHRDIKPCNVMKTSKGERPFILLDLGIAFSMNNSTLTYQPQNRLPVATHRYLAPEFADPNFRNFIDYRSDLYTSALTIFEYAAKTHPIASHLDDTMRTISRAIRETPKPLKSFRNDLSEEFTKLIDQMLKKSPSLRPANLKKMIQKIEGEL